MFFFGKLLWQLYKDRLEGFYSEPGNFQFLLFSKNLNPVVRKKLFPTVGAVFSIAEKSFDPDVLTYPFKNFHDGTCPGVEHCIRK